MVKDIMKIKLATQLGHTVSKIKEFKTKLPPCWKDEHNIAYP